MAAGDPAPGDEAIRARPAYAPVPAGAMRVRLVQPAALSEDELAEWRRFQRGDRLLQSPYLCPEFVRIVAGLRPGVEVAVVEQGGRPVAFFPFRRRGRVASPVAGKLSDCQAVIAAPGWEWDARALIRACGLTVYDFTFLRAAQRSFVPFHRRVVSSHVIGLADGFEAYARGRRAAGRDVIAKTVAQMRSLERQAGPVRFTMHDPDPRSLHRLIGWKREQYRTTGAMDAFPVRWPVELL